jgi:hypothetical protein
VCILFCQRGFCPEIFIKTKICLKAPNKTLTEVLVLLTHFMKVQKSISVYLLLVLFFSPGIHRLLHEHHPHDRIIKCGPNQIRFDEICVVCDFTISLFNNSTTTLLPGKFVYAEKTTLPVTAEFITKQDFSAISLRAPPAA